MDGGIWVASYVALWLTVLALCVVMVALLRQIGVLHTRLRPMGVHFAGEGPDRLEAAPPLRGISYGDVVMTVVVFTSPTCAICAELRPGLRALDRDYRDLRFVEVGLEGNDSSEVFRAFGVRSTPYVVAVDRHGVVQGRGVANSLEQVEVLIEEALASA